MIYIINRSQLYHRVLVAEIIQLLCTHQESNNHLAFVDSLLTAVDSALFIQINNAVRDHFGMDTQMLFLSQLGQYSVEAVTSYIEDGRTNSFYNVDINFLDKTAVEKMRREAVTDEKNPLE